MYFCQIKSGAQCCPGHAVNHETDCVLLAAKTDDHSEDDDDDKKEAGASDTEHPYSSSSFILLRIHLITERKL